MGRLLLLVERQLRAGLAAVKKARLRGTLPGWVACGLIHTLAVFPLEELDARDREIVVWARSQLRYFQLKPTLAKTLPRARGLAACDSGSE